MLVLIGMVLLLLPAFIIAFISARSAEVLHEKACFLCGIELDEPTRERLKAVTWGRIFKWQQHIR